VGAQNDFGTSGPEVLDGGEGSTDAGVICDFEGVVFWDIEVDPDEDFFSGNIEITDSEFIHNRRAFECLMVAGVSRMEEFGEGRSKFWVRRRVRMVVVRDAWHEEAQGAALGLCERYLWLF
jgi:hypothetical protein